MECHDARILLTFANRGCEELDAAERDAFQQHLEKCPECAVLALTDRHLDETIGRAMRDVPVPAGLKEKVLSRVASQRPRWSWKRTSYLAAAVLSLLAVAGGIGWHYYVLPEITLSFLQEYESRGKGWNEDQVEQYFAENGLRVRVPRRFDYDKLRHIDIVEVKGRRVAKLSFSRNDQERSASADVLILPPKQFNMIELPEMDAPQFTSIRIWHEDFTYIILCDGNLHALLRTLN